ncbi:MAG: DsbA family protein [Thermoleophilaceae bacterium]
MTRSTRPESPDLTSSGPPAPDELDHVRGDAGPLVVEYGDYECPFCARTDALLAGAGVRRVFRHFPVVSKHPRARVLAAAAEAAALQGRFWEMHDSLYADQGHLDDPHLWQRVERLGLDLDRFEADRRSDAVAGRVERDFRSGIRAGVVSTPTLFVDGEPFRGVPDAALLARLGAESRSERP